MNEEIIWKWRKKDRKQVEAFEIAIKKEILEKIQRHLKFSNRVDLNSIAEAIK